MSAPAPECYFVPGVVVVVVDPEPEALPDGVVVVVLLLPDGVVVVVLPLPVLLLPGVVVPGDADGGVVRSGVLPTRSESVWLQAAVVPTSNARAQKPDSILFIVDGPPCGVLDQKEGATDMPVAPDLTGSWTLTTTASYPRPRRGCATRTRRVLHEA